MKLELVVFIVLGGIVLLGVRTLRSNERAAVFRLGRLLHVQQPGTFWVIPFVDRIARVDLDARVPHWRSLDTDSIDRAVREIVLRAPPAA